MDELDLEYFETDGGLKYAVLETMDELEELGELDAYDETVAETHLYNYGVIFVGEFQDVLDNEYDLEEVFEHYQENQDAY